MDKKSSPQSWLFLGPEIGEKLSAIDAIRKKLSSRGTLDETVYYAGEANISAMTAVIRNSSLFSDLRLFIIKCVEEIKKKEDIDLFSSCISSPPEDAFLVLISEETSVARGIENTINPANRRVFWELPDYRKSQWILDFFKKEGFKISSEAVETILELVENNTAALTQECSRLIIFLDRDREITGEDVEKWLSHTREESAFTLFSRIAAGDLSRCLESSRMLLAAKEPYQKVLAGLASCWRKLINYILLKDAGVQDEAEYRKIGVSAPGAKRDYAAAASRYDCAAAEACLALTAEADFNLRAALSFPEEILMERYLFKIYSCSK